MQGHGCEPGPVVSCDNGNGCETSTCVEATMSCQYAPRDIDQDGDPGRGVPLRATTATTSTRTCRASTPRCAATGSTTTATGRSTSRRASSPRGRRARRRSRSEVPATRRCRRSATGTPSRRRAACRSPRRRRRRSGSVTVPQGGAIDLEVWVTSTVEVAVAIDGACGQASSELTCGSAPGATSVRARAYAVAPGTYSVVVITQAPSADVEVQVSFLPPSAPPANVTCATAAPITPGTALSVSIVDPLPTDLPTSCTGNTGELVYAFTLAQPQDLHVYATTTRGSGSPIVGIRDPGCTQLSDELACQVAGGALHLRGVGLGGDVLRDPRGDLAHRRVARGHGLAADPGPAEPDVLVAAGRRPERDGLVFLADHESAIKDGCSPSGPDAAYSMTLAKASDVLLIERIPQNESGAVSLDTPSCAAGEPTGVRDEGPTPVRVGKRNVPAGDYRAVLTDQYGLRGRSTRSGATRSHPRSSPRAERRAARRRWTRAPGGSSRATRRRSGRASRARATRPAAGSTCRSSRST